MLEEWAAFFWRFFKKQVIMVARSIITTTARQTTRIKTDIDSVVSLAPDSELGLTGSEKLIVLIYYCFLFNDSDKMVVIEF